MAQTINVNTTPGQFMPTLYYSQGDIGREFEIVLASSDGWAIPAGATVEMVATKPSGFGFSVAGTLTDNVASFTTTETMTNEHGRYPAEIRITSGTDVIGTANFYLSGERDPHPAETIDGDAEEIIPELTLLVERVEAAASSVLDMTVVANTLPAGSDATYSYDEETNTATFGIPKGADGSLASGVLAPTYSSSSTYAVGDYVYYSGNLYRCTTAITTAEAWTSGHWTQVAIAPEVTDVKSDINEIGDVIKTDIKTASAYVQGYINASGVFVGSTSWQTYAVALDETDAFRWDFFGYTNTSGFYGVAYYDGPINTGNFLGGVKFNAVGSQNFTVHRSDAPSGAKVIVFATRTASGTDQTLYDYVSNLSARSSTNTDVIAEHWGTPDSYIISMMVGGIVGASGADDPRSDRMRSDYLLVSDYGGTVNMPTGVSCIAHGYDADKTWISAYPDSNWQSSFSWNSFPNTFVYIRFVVNTGSLGENITTEKKIYDNKTLSNYARGEESAVTIPYTVKPLNQIARLGWDVYSPLTPPEQSIASYKEAYKHGCRIMLCDVRVTSDGEYVLWHDATLNNTVRHSDGTTLSDAELATTIAGSTLAELNAYDYGLYKGSAYEGMKIPMLNDFLKWIGLVDCAPMLEIKVELTTTQCVEIANMCKMYGLGERVIIDEYTTSINNTMSTWIANLPKATISIIGGSAIDLVIPKAQQIIQAGLNALVVLSTTAQLIAIQDEYGNIDYDKVQSVTDIGADFVYTEITSGSALEDFYDDGYLPVFKYVASSYVDINEWVKANILN